MDTEGSKNQPLASGPTLTLAWRFNSGLWERDEDFALLQAHLRKYPAATDEVVLFLPTGDHRAYEPLANTRRVLAIAAQRITQLRAAGIGKVGINVLSTLGHTDGPANTVPAMPFQAMVGPDGKASTACACPTDPKLRDYVGERYRLVAEVKPDFIWVDDDIRLCWHGAAGYSCFCPVCLAAFGWDGSREELVAKLNTPTESVFRLRWSEFIAKSMNDLLAVIRRAAGDVETGLMTCGYRAPMYGYHDIRQWLDTLDARRYRPGDGFWQDADQQDLLRKIFDVGMQVRQAGGRAPVVQYEAEGHPWTSLTRSAAMAATESEVSLFAGCNGIAYNYLPWERMNSLAEYEPHFQILARRRPFWERLVRELAGTRWPGLWMAHTNQLFARRDVSAGENWFANDGSWPFETIGLARLGVPVTPWREHACGTLLAERMAEGFSDEELQEILRGGVLLDARALQTLWERGLGELTGVRLGRQHLYETRETATAHPLNGADIGSQRDGHIGLGFLSAGQPAFALEPLEGGVEILSRLAAYGGAPVDPCFTLFTNKLGGRVAVASYAPWKILERAWKRRQMLAVCDWISGGRLPVVIEQHAWVMPFVRTNAQGRLVAVDFLNTSFDATGPLRVRCRNGGPMARLTEAGTQPLPGRQEGNDWLVELPSIPAWSTLVAVAQP